VPLLPSRSCKSIGCRGIGEDDGFCHNCRVDGKARDPRPSSRARGYDSRWQVYTKAFIAHHPLCVDPFNRHPQFKGASQVVDHREPHRGDMKLFWDHANHQPLCTQCHNFKTATVDGGFGRQRAAK
jgi:5-methylcytosine-specific restriction enzyme A